MASFLEFSEHESRTSNSGVSSHAAGSWIQQWAATAWQYVGQVIGGSNDGSDERDSSRRDSESQEALEQKHDPLQLPTTHQHAARLSEAADAHGRRSGSGSGGFRNAGPASNMW